MRERILASLFAAWLTALCPCAVDAQTEEGDDATPEIETDRDSFTPATTLAPQHRVIFESAWSFLDNRSVPDTNSFPETLFRYGLSDWLELRVGWNWEAGGAPNTISGGIGDPEEATGNELEFESQVLYGLKAALTEQNGWIPESACILQAGTPTTGADSATQFFTTYVFGWTLPNEWKWDSSIRYGFDSVDGDHFNIWAPSTVIKVPIGERWKAHAEYFGVFADGSASDGRQHYFSPGIHYLVTRNLEAGVRVGWGLNRDAASFFSNVGIGWQF